MKIKIFIKAGSAALILPINAVRMSAFTLFICADLLRYGVSGCGYLAGTKQTEEAYE